MYFAVGLILCILLWAQIEQNLLMKTNYHITSSKLGREFADTSFVVLSDLHNHSFGKNNVRLINKIDELAPNFIIVAGDMINKKEPCIPSNAYLLLEKLAKKYKIYYALGNHEQYIEQIELDKEYLGQQQEEKSVTNKSDSTWVEYVKRLSGAGVIFLDNKSITITKNKSKLCISGLTISREYYERGNSSAMPKDYVNHQLGKRTDNTFQLLIAHNPLLFEDYANWGADLTISGHLHGGLVRLPFLGGVLSPQVKFFPKYDNGRYHKNGKELIVSRGLGSHSSMFRLFNPPELVYIKFKK